MIRYHCDICGKRIPETVALATFFSEFRKKKKGSPRIRLVLNCQRITEGQTERAHICYECAQKHTGKELALRTKLRFQILEGR